MEGWQRNLSWQPIIPAQTLPQPLLLFVSVESRVSPERSHGTISGCQTLGLLETVQPEP